MKVRDLRRSIILTVSGIGLAAVVMWSIILPADIAAVFLVFVAAVIIQCAVVIVAHISQTSTAEEKLIERDRHARQLTDGRIRA